MGKEAKRNNRKQKDRDDFYIKVVKNNNIQRLYDFIYGSKRDEIDVLMRGVTIMFQQAKTQKERDLAVSLGKIIFESYKESLREKINRFRQRTGKSLNEEYEKAKNGNDNSLLRLIEFDKSYIYDNFAKERIQRAITIDDYHFLYDLSEALKRKLGKVDKIPRHDSDKQRNLRKLIRCFKIAQFDFTKTGAIRRLKKMIDEISISSKENLPNLTHSGQLKRTLKRMGVID